jgi:predicted metal-binding membrane protein
MIGVLRSTEDHRWYRLALGTLVLAAWAALALWGASPHAEWLRHHGVGEGHLPLPARIPLFLAGWTLMTVAMMLPGSLPLVNLFVRATAGRADRVFLVIGLVAGYLAAWAGVGLLAVLGDLALHGMVHRLDAEDLAARWLSPAILLAAGAFQFSALKHRCLTVCRSPYGFLAERWRGGAPARDAVRLGVHHGVFCVGCCWALMLLMFALGLGNLAWMLVLGTVMAAERATAWGHRVTRPVGAVLLVLGTLLLAGWTPPVLV